MREIRCCFFFFFTECASDDVQRINCHANFIYFALRVMIDQSIDTIG